MISKLFQGQLGEKLEGKSILAIRKNDNGNFLLIDTEKTTLKFLAEGDCCSSSWISSVDTPTSLEKVVSVEEKDVGRTTQKEAEAEYEKEHEWPAKCLTLYFYEIKTDKGSYTIEMRNESNGYYGGWLEFVSEVKRK